MQTPNSDDDCNDELTDSKLVKAVEQIEGTYCNVLCFFFKLDKNIHFTLFNPLMKQHKAFDITGVNYYYFFTVTEAAAATADAEITGINDATGFEHHDRDVDDSQLLASVRQYKNENLSANIDGDDRASNEQY